MRGAVMDGALSQHTIMVTRNLIRDSTTFMLTGSDGPQNVELSSDGIIGRIDVTGDEFRNAYAWVQARFTDPKFFENVGESYTLSVDIRANILNDDDAETYFSFDAREPIVRAERAYVPDTGGHWVRLSSTLVIPEGEQTRSLILFSSGTRPAKGSVIEYRRWKLEKGDRATAWTPAPEDLGLA